MSLLLVLGAPDALSPTSVAVMLVLELGVATWLGRALVGQHRFADLSVHHSKTCVASRHNTRVT